MTQVRPAPGGAGSIWDVEVIESKDVEPLANFTRSRVGESISVYIHPDLNKTIKPGDLLKARVFFQGDERSGVFFLKGDDVSRRNEEAIHDHEKLHAAFRRRFGNRCSE